MTDDRSPLHAKLYTKILLIAINKPPALPTPTAYIEQLTQEGVKSAPTARLYTSLCGLVKVYHKEAF